MFNLALRPGLVIFGVLVALLAIGPAAGSSLWTEQAKLTSSDGAEGDNFGNSVAISGKTALVGAPLVDSLFLVDSVAA